MKDSGDVYVPEAKINDNSVDLYIPNNYDDDLINASNYLVAALGDMSLALGNANDISFFCPTVEEMEELDGYKGVLNYLAERVSDCYTDFGSECLTANFTFDSVSQVFASISESIDNALRNVVADSIQDSEAKELLLKYINGEASINDVVNSETTLLDCLKNNTIGGLTDLTKNTLSDYISKQISGDLSNKMAALGIYAVIDFSSGVNASNAVNVVGDYFSTWLTNNIGRAIKLDEYSDNLLGGFTYGRSTSLFANRSLLQNSAAAAVTFAGNLAISFIDDKNISLDELISSGMKAGVSFAAGMLGDAAASLIAAPAGPIVSASVLFLGNSAVDYVIENMNYYEGHVPKEFTPITDDAINAFINDNGFYRDNLDYGLGYGTIYDALSAYQANGYSTVAIDLIKNTLGMDNSIQNNKVLYTAAQDFFKYNYNVSNMNNTEILTRCTLKKGSAEEQLYLDTILDLQEMFNGCTLGGTDDKSKFYTSAWNCVNYNTPNISN